MFYEKNVQWEAFVSELKERGVHIRWAWETRRDGLSVTKKRHNDVAMVQFHGYGFQPKHLTAIVVDYGEDGFGLYVNLTTATIMLDADEIAGPNSPYVKAQLTATA